MHRSSGSNLVGGLPAPRVRYRRRIERLGARGLVVVGALVVSTVASAALAVRGGVLDRSFGARGTVVTDFGAHETAFDVVPVSGGKLVLAGTSESGPATHAALARYERDGKLDPSFGDGGHVVGDWGAAEERAFGVAGYPGGRLLVAGLVRAAGGAADLAVARYGAGGSPDGTWGEGGLARTDFAGASDAAAAVAVQRDGKVVAVGSTRRPGEATDFAVARYDAEGRLDPSFAGDGRAVVDFGGQDAALALAIQANGRMVVAGYAGGDRPADDRQVALARLRADGTLDPAFGTGGRTVTNLPGADDLATGIALQKDGRILVSGGPSGDLRVLRYTTAGQLDRAFGRNGVGAADSGGRELAADVAVQRNGKIVAFGNTLGAGGPGDFVAARFLPNGTLDRHFGTRGRTKTDLTRFDDAEAVAVQADGKLVAAGSAGPGNFEQSFAVARYLPGTCNVPQLAGRTLAAARRALAAANCRLGAVRKAASRAKPGRVTSQSRRRGAVLPDWAKVGVVVSRGRKR